MESTRYKYSVVHENAHGVMTTLFHGLCSLKMTMGFHGASMRMVRLPWYGTIVESPRYGSLRAVTRVHSSQLWYGIIRLLHSYSQHIVFTPLPTLVWYGMVPLL